MADSIIGKISVGDGATFTPKIENDVLSWTNDKNLPNPDSLDIVGATFTPDVDEDGVLSWTNNKGLPNPDNVDIAQAVVDKKPGWGLPVGYEYFSINPNVPQGSLPLLGGEYNRSTYSDLWKWVQQQTGYLKTESEWQALSTANNGNVPYYSSGDGSTTFRVPSLQCWVRGANGSVSTVGSYLAAGLPNITGNFAIRRTNGDSLTILGTDGAYSQSTTSASDTSGIQANSVGNQDNVNFNASRSSSIYGNSNTVQPESIVGLWLVKAYGTIVDTGTIDEQQYIDDRIAALPNTFLPRTGGTMTGNIKFTITDSIARSVDNSFLSIFGGSGYRKGAYIGLSGKDRSGYTGAFELNADDGTTIKKLIGRPDGTLTWDGKEVERVNSSGSNYIRYESGLQIVFDKINMSGASSYVLTYTYPVAFKSGSSVCIATGNRWAASNEQVSIQNDNDTKFEVNITNAGSNSHNLFFIAIGRWK